jgi:CRP/FNR family transcriptional regulator, cyclic AMP receptor protein
MNTVIIPQDLLVEFGANLKAFQSNDVIFEEGSVCHYYFQVKTGRVRWCNIHEDGKEFLQNLIEPGESFGEIPLFDDDPYVSSAIANEDCEIYKLPKEQFHKLIEAHPKIHLNFSRLLSERLRYKFRLIKEISHKNPEQVVISLLDYLVEYDKNVCSECNLIKLTRQQIADMSGLRVETVIRVIKQLEKNNIVTIVRGKVHYTKGMTMVIKGKCLN